MKRLCIPVLLIVAVTTFGQTNPKLDAPDLKIIKLSWRDGEFGTSLAPGGAFSVEVKNTGSRAITAVEWQYILLDPVRKYVVDRLNFRTDDKTVEPGKTRKFTKRIEYPTVPDYITAVVRITKVEYADGTAWERPNY